MRFGDVIKLDIDEIKEHVPALPGIYEVGYWVAPSYFVPRYLGRARGRLDGDPEKKGTTIRSRLLKHARGSGSKNIARALAGDHEGHWLDDPDDLEEAGRQKMLIHADLWCRWMVARSCDEYSEAAAKREAGTLQSYGIGKGNQYVWNKRLESS